MGRASDPLDRLVEDVLASVKYRDVSPELIRNIGAQELQKRRTLKEAQKATRNKLHQVCGAYFDGQARYKDWLAQLKSFVQEGEQLREACRQMMSYHASTRERLSSLDLFYETLYKEIAPVHSILDLACGLNPLAIPWMPLAPECSYYAYDIYQQMTGFLDEWLTLLKIDGHARACDILQFYPEQQVDVALILKTMPCLEQVDKQAGKHLLNKLKAQHIIVSFPVHSLGGRGKGMTSYYEEHFRAMLAGESWTVQRYEFATELAFVVTK